MRSLILHIIQRKKWVINHILQRNVENKQQIMKGKITKIDEEWVVRYDVFQDDHSYPLPGWNFIPLHPDDIKQINADAQVFDNIEARIKAYPDVEFDWCVIIGPDGKGFECAKLKQNNA
jgi:hypothetical protein